MTSALLTSDAKDSVYSECRLNVIIMQFHYTSIYIYFFYLLFVCAMNPTLLTSHLTGPPLFVRPPCSQSHHCHQKQNMQRRALTHDEKKPLATCLLPAGSFTSAMEEEEKHLQAEVNSGDVERRSQSDREPFSFSLSSLHSANHRDLEAWNIDPQPHSTRPGAAHFPPI